MRRLNAAGGADLDCEDKKAFYYVFCFVCLFAFAFRQKKTQIPLTPTNASTIQGYNKLKLKLTGFLLHSIGWLVFLTLPWITTGANLSCTILMVLMARGHFDTISEFLVQWDGVRSHSFPRPHLSAAPFVRLAF